MIRFIVVEGFGFSAKSAAATTTASIKVHMWLGTRDPG
jgi:hypothetical protein